MTAIQQPPADIREMYMAHTMFRREFSAMPGLVRAVEAGDVRRAGVVADHIDLVKRVLHDHHHGEDVHLWPKLFQRGSGEIAPMVDLMESQHRTIGRIIEDIDASIGAWRCGTRCCGSSSSRSPRRAGCIC